MASELLRTFPERRRVSVAMRTQRVLVARFLIGATVTVLACALLIAGYSAAERFGAGAFFAVGSAAGAEATIDAWESRGYRTIVVTVRPGDTLWSIARAVGPGGTDVRQVVDWIRDANGLENGLIRPGEHLFVPSGAPGVG